MSKDFRGASGQEQSCELTMASFTVGLSHYGRPQRAQMMRDLLSALLSYSVSHTVNIGRRSTEPVTVTS